MYDNSPTIQPAHPIQFTEKSFTNPIDIGRLTSKWFSPMGLIHHPAPHKTIYKMEEGDEIVFADECGTWMITGDENRFVKSYLSSLSAISTPEEYANDAIPLIKRDSFESFHNKVYATATKICNEDQKIYLKTEVKKQKIRTRSK